MNWSKFWKLLGIGINRSETERMHSAKWFILFCMFMISIMTIIMLFPVSVEVNLDLTGEFILNENITVDNAHISMRGTVPLILAPLLTTGVSSTYNPSIVRKVVEVK